MTWHDARAHLSHDVLSNHVENELLSLEINPSGGVIRLRQLLIREDELSGLLDGATDALSWARILDGPLFKVWDDAMRSQVKDIAHKLFVLRSGVPEKVEALRTVMAESVEEARRFLATDSQLRTKEQVAALRRQITRLRTGISSLPRDPGDFGRLIRESEEG